MLFAGYTSPTLTFLGVAAGAAISFWASLATVATLGPSVHAVFMAMAVSASALAAFFGWLSGRGWLQARAEVQRIKASSARPPA